ncbi:MAG: hypothetical protein AAGG02_10810, partial [Cyanobacteria bacterium P01_H01_bin.15]
FDNNRQHLTRGLHRPVRTCELKEETIAGFVEISPFISPRDRVQKACGVEYRVINNEHIDRIQLSENLSAVTIDNYIVYSELTDSYRPMVSVSFPHFSQLSGPAARPVMNFGPAFNTEIMAARMLKEHSKMVTEIIKAARQQTLSSLVSL